MTHPGSQGGPVPAASVGKAATPVGESAAPVGESATPVGESAATEVASGVPRAGGKAPGGMWWVAWRQHRAQLAISLGVLFVLGVALLVFRLLLVDRIQELTGGVAAACTEFGFGDASGTPGCTERVYGTIQSEFDTVWGLLRLGLLVLPVVLGAFVGAPVFAREFEQHTPVYVLTQSVGRIRWWATKVTVAGVPVVLAVVGVGVLMEWAATPFVDFASSPMDSPGFETRGMVPAALTLLTVAIGVTAGIATRSTVIALAATVIVGGLLVVGLTLVRPHLLDPVRVQEPVGIASTVFFSDLQALYLGSGYLDAGGAPIAFDGNCPALENAAVTASSAEIDRLWLGCLREGGIVQQYAEYLPGERRTALQLVVSGISAGVAALVLAAGALLLRRRVM